MRNDFFKNLFDNPKIGMVMVVIHNEKVIGGAFNLYWPGAGIYSMYYCGLRDYHKKIFPTHFSELSENSASHLSSVIEDEQKSGVNNWLLEQISKKTLKHINILE
jgi:hypothetical protein